MVDILVGVGFFLGGRAAAAIVNNVLNTHSVNDIVFLKCGAQTEQTNNTTNIQLQQKLRYLVSMWSGVRHGRTSMSIGDRQLR